MAISKKTWTGTAKEATPGTAITPPTQYHPTKAVFKGTKKREYLNEERGDRNANYGVVDSIRQSSIEMTGPYYPDVGPIQLWGWAGLPTSAQPAATTNPTVWQHTFALADIPPSYTVARNLDARAYTVPYSVVEKLDFQFAAEGKLFEVKSSWVGMFAQIYASPPVPTFSTVLPMAGYAPTVKFVDNVVSNDVADMTINFAQKCTLWYPANGSPDFVTVYFGERSITVDMTARFDNDTLYQRFRNNVQDSLTFDIKGANIGKNQLVTLGSPSAGNFTLTYNGQTTGNIVFNAAASVVQTALQGLTGVGANATVQGSAGGPYTVIFAGPLLNDGFLLSGSGAGLTGGTFAVGAPTFFNNELNIVIPQLSWDSMEHDTSKDNVLIKAKGTAIVPAGASLITGFAQNTVSSYTT